MAVSSCFVCFGEGRKTKMISIHTIREGGDWKHGGDTQMQDKAVEQMEWYIWETYRTLPEEKRKELEAYAAALKNSQLTHDRR